MQSPSVDTKINDENLEKNCKTIHHKAKLAAGQVTLEASSEDSSSFEPDPTLSPPPTTKKPKLSGNPVSDDTSENNEKKVDDKPVPIEEDFDVDFERDTVNMDAHKMIPTITALLGQILLQFLIRLKRCQKL